LKRQLRRTAVAILSTGAALALLAGCGAPSYTYAADNADKAYFKVPYSWQQVSASKVAEVQSDFLSNSAAGAAGGSLTWSRAYTAATAQPALTSLLTGSQTPVVYASVQTIRDSLRASLSFDYMRDLLFPVTSEAREEAAAEGEKLSGFNLVFSNEITEAGGVRGINELFEYDINGQPDAFDQTVMTNSETTKLYLLLVQCYQACFASHSAQIKAVVSSFTVRGS
jgi:hypothetical protein